jgi:hypothetical protein
MFGWFRPACPLATAEKVWVERRMAWLAQRLGMDRLRRTVVIEPNDSFFPEPYLACDEDAHRIFQQVRGWMSIDPGRVVFELHDEIVEDITNPLGLYVPGDPARILIQRSLLENPESLVAVVAHELSHEILLGGGHLQDNNEDLERLTDLTTVFFGLGIFCENSALQETTLREGRFSWWSIHKQGYLPIRMYGYGMALFAWAREELSPSWMQHLRLDAREAMSKGLRFLRKGGDVAFESDQAEESPDGSTLKAAVARLNHQSPSQRFWGLSELLESATPPAEAVETVARLTDDPDPDVSSAAARLLGISGAAAQAHVPRLLEMLGSRTPANRVQAALALGALRPAEPVVPRELGRLLDDQDAEVCQAAAEALGEYGAAAQCAERQLLRRYEQALIKCDACIDSLAEAVVKIFPDAQSRIRHHFQDIDEEICRFAEQCLLENQESPEDQENGKQIS